MERTNTELYIYNYMYIYIYTHIYIYMYIYMYIFKYNIICTYMQVLRGFSAPVKLEMERTDAELAFLMGNDSDSFNKWEAGQTLFTRSILALVAQAQKGEVLSPGTHCV